MTPPITQLVEYWKEYKEEMAAHNEAELSTASFFRTDNLTPVSLEGFMDWLERKVK